MLNVEQTIISQYANAPTMTRMIQNMNAYIDPAADIDAFYNLVFNVATAKGFGLDIWGRIVVIDRALQIPPLDTFLGFKQALHSPPVINDPQPWNQAPFFSRTAPAAPNTVLSLQDEPYRTLIFTKALANICDCTIPMLNRLVRNLFAGRGVVYVTDNGNMQMGLTFGFKLQAFEVAIITTSGAFPKPAGVSLSISVP